MALIPQRSPKLLSEAQRGNRFAALGDSIVRGNTQNDKNILGGASWFTYMCAVSGQRLRHTRNAGVSSDTTAMMLARLDTDVLAYDVTHCLVMGGTNDVGDGAFSLATTSANLTQIYNRLRAHNIQPILCTIPPRQDTPTIMERGVTLNAWIRWHAQAHGYPLVDFYSLVTNPSNGQYRAGYSTDTVHPTPVAAREMGEYAAVLLANIVPPWTPYLTYNAGDAINMITTGTFNTDTNADGIADSWVADAPGGTVTYSRVSDTDYAFRQRLAYTGAGVRTLSQAISSSKWSIGDTLAFSGRVWFEAESGSLLPVVTVEFTNGDEPKRLRPFEGVYSVNLTNAVFYMEGVIPPNTTAVSVQAFNAGGTGTGSIDVAQLTLLNLTRLGLV